MPRLTKAALRAGAAERDLGKIRVIHRSLNSFGSKPIGIITGGTTIGVLFFATRGDWLALVTTIAVGALLIFAYRHFFDVPAPRRIAVADHGLILDGSYGAIVGIPWTSIESAEFGPAGEDGPTFVLRARDGQRFHLGTYTAHSALIRSLVQRRLIPVSPWPRVLGVAAVVVLVGLAVWLVVLPRFVVRSESALPTSSDSFADACDSPGVAFTAAAPYAGPPPHPLLVAPPDVRWRIGKGASPWFVEDPATVQLIACVNFSREAGSTTETCVYSSSNLGIGGRVSSETMKIGRYDLIVYELRTRREITRTTITGENTTCPEVKLGDDDVYTTPTDAQLHAALDEHINRTL